MKNFAGTAGITLAGLFTSILTAGLVALLHLWTGFNLFSLSIAIVLPAGALVCGFLAASGYYLGARLLHQKPSTAILIQMVAIAAFTQALIYWLEYRTASVQGIPVSSFVSFSDYLNVILTKTHMRIGRAARVDTGELGLFGYGLAVIDFVGFLVGGAFVYTLLKGAPSCGDCDKYLRSILKKKDSFVDSDEFAPYYQNVYAHPVDSAEFATHVGREYSAGKAQAGTINLTTTIFECPQCSTQAIRENVQLFNGSQWKAIEDLDRLVAIPKGIDVRPAFN